MRKGNRLAGPLKPLHRVDHYSHLGGYASGIAAGLVINQRMPLKSKQGKPVAGIAEKEVVKVVP